MKDKEVDLFTKAHRGLAGGELGWDDPHGGLLSRLCGGERGLLSPGPRGHGLHSPHRVKKPLSPLPLKPF